jgi:hypothetical protein
VVAFFTVPVRVWAAAREARRSVRVKPTMMVAMW